MNIPSLCRLCLMPNSEGDFHIIFALNTSYNIVEFLRTIPKLEVTENDGLSQLICNECVGKIDLFHEFIVRCQQSHRTQKHEFLSNTKDEVDIAENTQVLHQLTDDELDDETEDCSSNPEANGRNGLSLNIFDSVVSSSDGTVVVDPLVKIAEHSEPNYTQCCGCIEHFANYDGLKAHAQKCHLPDRPICGPVPEKQIECCVCYKVFSSIGYLDTLHRLNAFKGRLQTIDKPDAVQCCACETICTDLTELGTHGNEVHMVGRIVHDPTRPYECRYCFRRYTRKQALSYHQKYSYSYKKMLVMKRRGCRVIRRRMETEAAGEVRKCCGCLAEFHSEEALRQHSQMHHKLYRVQVDGAVVAKDTERRPGHECDICYKQFPTPLRLELHKSIPYSRTHRCGHCSREFIKRSLLENHLRNVHQIEAQPQKSNTSVNYDGRATGFQCEECGAIRASKYLLQSHRKVHSEHKPFTCTVCGERFKRKQNLQSHLRKHTGERSVRCRHCAKLFGADADRNRHEIAHHTHQFRLQCDLCGTGFLRKRTLEQHRKRQHVD